METERWHPPPIQPARLALALVPAVLLVLLVRQYYEPGAEDRVLAGMGYSTDLPAAGRPGENAAESDSIIHQAIHAVQDGRLSELPKQTSALRTLLNEAHKMGAIGRPIAPTGTNPYARGFYGDPRETLLLELEWAQENGFELESKDVLQSMRTQVENPELRPDDTRPAVTSRECRFQDHFFESNPWTSVRLRLAQALGNQGVAGEAAEILRELEVSGRAASPAFFQAVAKRALVEEPLRTRYSTRRADSPLAESPLLSVGRALVRRGDREKALTILQEDLEAALQYQPIFSYALYQRLLAFEEAFKKDPPENPRYQEHRERIGQEIAKARELASTLRGKSVKLPKFWDRERWQDDWEMSFGWLEGRFVTLEHGRRR